MALKKFVDKIGGKKKTLIFFTTCKFVITCRDDNVICDFTI